ncbi:MAG: hypothetical protein K6A35_00095 [bacterium]|nr:hypothetical protein [bacterium]
MNAQQSESMADCFMKAVVTTVAGIIVTTVLGYIAMGVGVTIFTGQDASVVFVQSTPAYSPTPTPTQQAQEPVRTPESTPTPSPLPMSTLSPEDLENIKIVATELAQQETSCGEYANLQIGQQLKFGRYPQGANNEIKPITWRVLKRDSDSLLVISERALESRRYDLGDRPRNWE